MKKNIITNIFYVLSLYKSNIMSVSEFVCSFPNSSKTTKPDELKFWGMIPLELRKVLG